MGATLLTLWEVLDDGTVSGVSEPTRTVIVWNESATFYVYVERVQGLFENIDVFTNHVTNHEHAKQVSEEWFKENLHH
jgi:hypothetical protein